MLLTFNILFLTINIDKKRDRLLSVLKRKSEEKAYRRDKLVKIELKRTAIYDKLLLDQKHEDTEVYKKYRKELIQSEQKSHDKSLETKRKNYHDYLDYKRYSIKIFVV